MRWKGLFLAAVWPAAAEAAPAISPYGEWQGTYSCGVHEGAAPLDLKVERTSDGKLAATFSFGPSPQKPKIPNGSFLMAGTFDSKTRHLALHGVDWIKRPLGYLMIDIDGQISRDGLSYAGKVLFSDCTTFSLSRIIGPQS